MTVFTPLKNFVVLELEDETENLPSPGVIVLVGGTEPRVRYAKVLTVGPEVRDLRPGQRVLASITAGVELAQDHLVVPQDAILAFVD